MKALRKVDRELLESIAAAGTSGTFVDADKAARLVENQLIEVKADKTDADGKIAARCTERGFTAAAPSEPTEPKGSPAMTVSKIVSGVELPKRRAAGRSSVYPFDQLGVGQSFFVPNTAERPNAAKSLGGTVSSANKRFSELTGEMTTNRKGREVPETRQLRKFVCRAVEDGAKWGEEFAGVAGAAILREE